MIIETLILSIMTALIGYIIGRHAPKSLHTNKYGWEISAWQGLASDNYFFFAKNEKDEKAVRIAFRPDGLVDISYTKDTIIDNE